MTLAAEQKVDLITRQRKAASKPNLPSALQED
jgi:hypothetical protein